MANEGLGKDTKLALEFNDSAWETGAAKACGANSGFLVDDWPLLDERPIRSTVSLGQPRPTSWVQQAIQMGGQFNKKFRFGGKDHQLIAGCLGTVGTLSFRGLTQYHASTATGGSATTLIDTGESFGTSGELDGKYLIINSGGAATYRIEPIISHTDTVLTVASGTAIAASDVYEVVDFAPAVYDISTAGSTATTIVSAAGGLTINAHSGSWVRVISGTGADQTRGITSNTVDTFTVDSAWDTTPDATSVFEVMDAACTHIYEIGSTNGIYFTACADIVTYIKEIPHLKLGAFSITGTYDDDVMLQVTTVGDQEVTDSVINTDSASWTIREQNNEVPMKKTTTSLLMNRQSGSALVAGTDDRKVNDFTFSFEQSIEGSLRTGPGSDNIVSEPLQNAHPITKLAFTEPLTETSTLKDERKGNYAQKGSLIITGAALNANQNREMIILMPKAALNEVNDPVNDSGFVVTSVDCELFDAEAAPSGISYTDAFKIEITDDYGGNPIQLGNT
jgi:hypothetical protein